MRRTEESEDLVALGALLQTGANIHEGLPNYKCFYSTLISTL